jgi:CheY-like chemotaxis protein
LNRETGVVLALVGDLFFGAKLTETARQVGVPLALVGSAAEARAAMAGPGPALVIFDLEHPGLEPLAFIRELKTMRPAPRLLGFLSHVRQDLKAAAQGAGCDEVLPRSQFSARLPDLLRQAGGATQPPSTADAPC